MDLFRLLCLRYSLYIHFEICHFRIDHLARQLGLKMRVAVFEYVAYILGVSKQTLTGKIKKAIRRKEVRNCNKV